MLETKNIQYQDGNTSLIGWLAQDNSLSGKKPVVLIVHDWSGRNDFACQKALKIAELGYVGFAVDMYGNAKTGTTTDEKSALMKPFMTDRSLLLRRLRCAVDAVKALDITNSNKIAVIGYCFGGLCALDLARNSQDISGAVSLHGLLSPPEKTLSSINTKILALHGHDDPMVPPDQVFAFEQEMTNAHADWQLIVFGGTKHAFCNPLANDPILGTLYNPTAERRSWVAVCNFLSELFTADVSA